MLLDKELLVILNTIGSQGGIIVYIIFRDSNKALFYSAVIKPYLFDATVAPYNIRIELTPTDHAAVLRVTFPKALGDDATMFMFIDL